MSTGTSALTLVRFWIANKEAFNGFVAEWRDGFTVSTDHPIAEHLRAAPSARQYKLTVYSTDELEWLIEKWTIQVVGEDQYEMRVDCIPRLQHLRRSLISDDWLIGTWFAAEAKWLDTQTPPTMPTHLEQLITRICGRGAGLFRTVRDFANDFIDGK